MDFEKNSQATSLSFKGIITLFMMLSLPSLISIPFALAREAQAPVTVKEQAQPAVRATSIPEPENAIPRTPETYSSENSADFLMEEPPLTKNASPDTTSPVMAQTPPEAGPSPVTLQVLQGALSEKTDEVAMLVSEQCSQDGNTAKGANSCERSYSNGHHTTVLTQNANEGDELKRQTVIEEFDGDNTLLYRKTIRHRVDYNYLRDQKAKEKEFFDIIYQPSGKKTTRELMVYEYFLETGKTRSLSWTQYQQIATGPKAELVYHAMLRYGDDGNPDRGIAEQWNKGEKTDTFMDWNRRSKGFAMLDEENWKQWEGWIRNVSLQAYLP